MTPDAYGWYDFGTGEGGNILDLAYRIHSSLPSSKLEGEPVKEALAFIQSVVGAVSYVILPSPQKLPIIPEPHAYTQLQARPFSVYGRGSGLTKSSLYLDSQGVNADRAAPYLSDVIYAGNDGKRRYGFGLANVSGGYEIRRYGDRQKRSVGTKDVSLFKAEREHAHWHCFYSMIDFCTFLSVDKPPVGAYNYFILNSDSLVKQAVAYLDRVPVGFMIHYPHNDESGQRAYSAMLDKLAQKGWSGGDKAYLYEGFKDYTLCVSSNS